MALMKTSINTFIEETGEEFKSTRLGSSEASIVHLEFVDSTTGERYQSMGTAKKHPKDESNPALGMKIATFRALVRLAYQLHEEVEWELDSEICPV